MDLHFIPKKFFVLFRVCNIPRILLVPRKSYLFSSKFSNTKQKKILAAELHLFWFFAHTNNNVLTLSPFNALYSILLFTQEVVKMQHAFRMYRVSKN